MTTFTDHLARMDQAVKDDAARIWNEVLKLLPDKPSANPACGNAGTTAAQ